MDCELRKWPGFEPSATPRPLPPLEGAAVLKRSLSFGVEERLGILDVFRDRHEAAHDMTELVVGLGNCFCGSESNLVQGGSGLCELVGKEIANERLTVDRARPQRRGV